MVSAVAGAAVGAVLGAVVKNVVSLVVKLVQKRCELWKGFPNDIDFIQRELLMIAGAEEDQLSGKAHPSAVMSISMEEMRDLAHDIEDCLDRILRYAEGEGEAWSFLHRVKAVGSRAGSPPFSNEIKQLKARLKAAHQRKLDYNVNGGQSSSSSAAAAAASMYTTRVEPPVGIDKPKQELLELLLGDDIEGQPEQLSVISIVGIAGSGKSTLAKAVYECPEVVGRFPRRAWVVASKHRGNDTRGILQELLDKLRPGPRPDGEIEQLRADISSYLDTERYLIVFDDIEEQQWNSIKSTFPGNTGSRVIVTTIVQAVGKVCCHGNGYIYNMATLDVKHSKELLEAVLKGHSLGLEPASIVNKCDGHPLALVSVANYLLRKHVLTEKDCDQVCRSLGHHMAKECAFMKLRQVLMNNYCSLNGHLLKTCLLYMCVFPNGHPIRRKSLMKRWLAEGYAQYQHPRSASLVADENFEELIDRNIIRPIESSKNAKVKTCKAHGIMHEFMLHMSTSAKFITSLDNPERSTYRHLFVENNSSSKASDVNHNHISSAGGSKSRSEKFRARSLTIFGSAGDAAEDYSKCELLRVLDLEECDDLKNDHTNDIHKLWHLKYLSLGASISSFPSKIEKLHCLETLDARKTKIDVLPVEVMKLPYLAHLLGKFKLGKRDWKLSEVDKFLPKESNLMTLSGFVTDGNPGFPMLMARMKKLRKVKIWCNDNEDCKSLAEISTAIKKFLQDELDTSIGVRSLSLHLGNSSENILRSLENSYFYLSSLKLHGALNGQTQFLTSLCGLTDLCLSSSNNLTSIDLSNLVKLKHLEYLKLVNVSLGGFIIRRRDFPRLLRLSLVQSSPLPTIGEGALAKLVSLQLLCEDLAGLSGIRIECHKHLQEVGLDCMVSQETISTWEEAAKKHPNRPRVLFFQKVDPNETAGSMMKYVATKRPAAETESPAMEEEPQIPTVQPISVEELSTIPNHVDVAGPSMAPTNGPNAMSNVIPSSSSVVS
ncbi:hypothetical protein ACP4OV_009106 [Aristida adscensionis]